jgi:elongation factor G
VAFSARIVPSLRSHYKVGCDIGPMKVAFRERPGRQTVSVAHEVCRMVGGREQQATVHITLERADGSGSPRVRFADSTKGLDAEVAYAVREGVLAACSRGALKGYAVMDAAVTVDKVEYEVDTTVGVVAQCASESVRRALREADVRLLHPVMQLEVSVDAKCVQTLA